MVDRIKKIIEKFFNTQVNFAKYLNVSKQQVNNYLTNKNNLTLDNIIKLINDYNINPLWLLTGRGNMLLTDDDKTSNDDTIKQLQAQITELQADNDKLQAQIDVLKSIIQSNQK